MKTETRFWMFVVLNSAIAGALLLWTVQLLWHAAGKVDSNPSQPRLKNQLMQRKAEAMHDILDEMVAGDLRRVHSAAKRMDHYSEAIDKYLANKSYDKFGEEFHDAVDELRAASARRDFDSANEAVLRLEKSCVTCHRFLDTQATLDEYSSSGLRFE